MLFDVDHHIKIASRPGTLSRLALTRQSQPRARVHASRYFHFKLLFFLDSALASAGFTGVGDRTARAAALLAGAADREESLLESNLS